ncbi:MAG: MBL fold metallo-hydrolase [Acidobacteria bacterium]|nr:MBL fold metallo-hydrolase [Acidobacteriota bacterium]
MRATAPLLGLLLATAPLAAHVKHARNSQADQKIHRVEKLADNVYCIFGNGGNIGLVVTDQHAVLIDDQFDKLLPGLREAVKSVTDKPIKYLINTHHHGDHTGGNRGLEGQVVAILAHRNVRKHLLEAQKGKPADQQGGLPELTVGEEDPRVKARMDIHLGGVEMHLLHYQAGHTDGDIMVGIPGASVPVIHMGDLFFNGTIPYIDLKGGGNLTGMLENVEHVLGFVPDTAKIIPGHGPVATKKDLTRFRDFLKAVQAHVKAHPKMSGQELDAAFDHTAWADVKAIGDFLSYANFFEIAAGRVPARR